GRRSTIVYRPSASVTTVRTFSIKAGLAASTVTPGSTPPDVSLTTPATPLACCAEATTAHNSDVTSAALTRPCLIIASAPLIRRKEKGERATNTYALPPSSYLLPP